MVFKLMDARLRFFWRLRSVGFFLVVLSALSGCNERPPQYQMIPAVLDGDMGKVRTLLDDTAHVNINWRAGGDGETALIVAAGHNKIAIAKLLLARGADPNIATDENNTPLQAAAYHGFTEMVKLLIEAGADVNAAETRYGHSPLMMAARKGHGDVVKLLLDAGADRNATTKDSRSASTLAQQNGHLELAQLLLFYQPHAETQPMEKPASTGNLQ